MVTTTPATTDGFTIHTRADGSLAFVYEDAERVMGAGVRAMTAGLGLNTRRASHVEPDDDGRWWADMGPMDGPVFGPFDLRGEALAAEHAWLEANL